MERKGWIQRILNLNNPADRQFTEQYGRLGYSYLCQVERYEGQERSDIELATAPRVEGREFYIDWDNVKTPVYFRDSEATPQVVNGVKAAKDRMNSNIVELGSLFVKK